MSVKLYTEHHLELVSFKGDCTGPPESTLVKMPHCWDSHVAAHMFWLRILLLDCTLLSRSLAISSAFVKVVLFDLITFFSEKTANQDLH